MLKNDEYIYIFRKSKRLKDGRIVYAEMYGKKAFIFKIKKK